MKKFQDSDIVSNIQEFFDYFSYIIRQILKLQIACFANLPQLFFILIKMHFIGVLLKILHQKLNNFSFLAQQFSHPIVFFLVFFCQFNLNFPEFRFTSDVVEQGPFFHP